MISHNFRKLEVWNRSMTFVAHCYEVTSLFPYNERFGLIDQVRRAAISINLNIAEGSGSSSDNEFIRFLYIARRSSYEVAAGFEIAQKLGLVNDKTLENIIQQTDELSAMLSGLIKSLKSNNLTSKSL